jgi:hypothetical protein
LAGVFGGTVKRSCTVKAGKALFFPLLNSVKWTPIDINVPEDCGNQDGMSRADIIRDCRNAAAIGNDDIGHWTCTIDNIPCVWNSPVVRAQSKALPFHIMPNSLLTDVFEYQAGIRDISVSDGYWVMLNPLPPGKHTLHFTSAYSNANEDFMLDVTYDLTVTH